MKKRCISKIIIIDNDSTSISQLKNILISYKCKVDNVDNDKEAVDKIILNNYDFYFISFPINGCYLISLINTLKQDSKIIAMSDDASLKTEELIRSCGITYLLKKPFSKSEIKQLIEH